MLGDPAIPPAGRSRPGRCRPVRSAEAAARGLRPARLALVADAERDHRARTTTAASPATTAATASPVARAARSTTCRSRHWPKAIAAGAELRTNARVERIETDETGRATGAVYVDRHDGHAAFPGGRRRDRRRQRRRHAALAAPLGERPLPGRSGQLAAVMVGRHLMHHGLAHGRGLDRGAAGDAQGESSRRRCICEEFAETDAARGFINGFTMHIVRMNGAGYQAHGSHSGNVAPWGAEHHRWFREPLRPRLRHPARRRRSAAAGEPGHALRHARPTRDGLPAPRIDYKLHPERRADDGLRRRAGARAGRRRSTPFDVKVNR